jgi:hypothetical protein
MAGSSSTKRTRVRWAGLAGAIPGALVIGIQHTPIATSRRLRSRSGGATEAHEIRRGVLELAAMPTVDKLTREQMVAEFGDTGVQNPAVIDLITLDKDSDTVVLVMTERRPWGAVAEQLKQIEEKVNRYMGYALDGFLAEQYPQYLGKAVRFRLDCAEAPHGEAVRFVEAMTDAVESHGIHFAMAVLPPSS